MTDPITLEPEPQTTGTVVLVRPASFGYDEQTAASNAFQQRPEASADRIARDAIAEFDRLHGALEDAGVRVLVIEDRAHPRKPDAVFPNNWFSTHRDDEDRGVVVVYPMHTPSRRPERVVPELLALFRENGFRVDRTIDLTNHEGDNRALEGTGSLVLDRPRRLAFASRSVRTDDEVLAEWASALGYTPIAFTARDPSGVAFYHTNVMMWIGTSIAGVALESVEAGDRARLLDSIEASGRALLTLTTDQIASFAGNAIELRDGEGRAVLVLSRSARAALRADQLSLIEQHARVIAVDVPTIERVGGGSVRCMIAEVFLPAR